MSKPFVATRQIKTWTKSSKHPISAKYERNSVSWRLRQTAEYFASLPNTASSVVCRSQQIFHHKNEPWTHKDTTEDTWAFSAVAIKGWFIYGYRPLLGQPAPQWGPRRSHVAPPCHWPHSLAYYLYLYLTTLCFMVIQKRINFVAEWVFGLSK